MLEAFYSHLEEKSANDSELRLLRAQWDFDHLLLENALQHVGSVFNHYSRHDSSHSRKILVNIAKLLGDKLQLLSATDTWLIMEGAFLHDTGMLASREDILETKEKAEFVSFVRSIARDKLHELNCLALQYNPDDPLWCFKKAENPVAAVEQWYQLLATWFRGRHGVRSGDTVLHPENKGIHSPRSSLIPHRLLRCLSKICRMHTAPFDNIKVELQQFEDGMSNELCHPRFVACLLRMGDLLDMDNGRFCPVMAALYGKGPRSKVAHLDKHESIVHLRCSEQFIEAHAECETDEGYLATSDWFAMLEKEASSQLQHWDEIVPVPGLMSIPVVKVQLRHKDMDLLLRDGRLPKLSLSENEVFEILQGADIYEHKWQSLRELLQNAEDATLVRLWICHKKDILEKGNSPLSEYFCELLKKYPILVKLRKTIDNTGNAILHVLIEDKGCGISRETFEKMLLVGSGKDSKLQNVIDDMPEWLKPSGAFGLGLQSAFFMGAQRLVFSTRSLLDNSAAQITIPSQLGLGGFAKYKSLAYEPGADYGCELSFSLTYRDDFVENVRQYFSYRYRSTSSYPESDEMSIIVPDPLKEKDDFLHDPVFQAIFFEIKKFARGSFAYIELEDGDKQRCLDKIKRNESNFWFNSETNILISKLPTEISWKNFFQGYPLTLYRGQYVGRRIGIHWIGEFDILYGCAKNVLSISRNNIKKGFIKELLRNICKSIVLFVSNDYEFMNDAQRNYISLYMDEIETLSGLSFPEEISRKGYEKIVFNDEGNTILEMLNEKKDFILYTRDFLEDSSDSMDDSSYESIKVYSVFDADTFFCIVRLLIKNGFYVKHITNYDGKLLISKKMHEFYSDSAYFCYQLSFYTDHDRFSDSRVFIPSSNNFKELTVNIPEFGVSSLFQFDNGEDRMILPYEMLVVNAKSQIKREDEELYVNWVFNNSKLNPKPDKEVIRKKYYEFIEYFEKKVVKNCEKWQKVFISDPFHGAAGK